VGLLESILGNHQTLLRPILRFASRALRRMNDLYPADSAILEHLSQDRHNLSVSYMPLNRKTTRCFELSLCLLNDAVGTPEPSMK
jgi:hypothetical protein